MKLILLSSILVAVAAVIVFGQHIVPRACPEDREVVHDFDLNEYTGRWYEIQRYDQPYEKDGDCGYAIYTLNEEVPNSIHIKNTMIKLPNGVRTKTLGFGVLSYSEVHPEAKLNVTLRPNVPANKSNYWILSTDYTSYAIIYGCRNLNGTHAAEAAWVLSRNPTLADESKPTVDAVVAKYFDEPAFRITNQNAEACGYVD